MAEPIKTRSEYKKINKDSSLPMYNSKGELIVIGCNYHTTWQSKKAMRFVLTEVYKDKARLQTRGTMKDFWTPLDDLIFIRTKHNISKSEDLRSGVKLNHKLVKSNQVKYEKDTKQH